MNTSKNKKILIFSFSYYPYVGGAEVAIKEITDRLPDVAFDMVTFSAKGGFASGQNLSKGERVGNVNVYRLSGFSKYIFPFKSFLKGLFLYRRNSYDTVWAVHANAGFAPLFLKIIFPRLKFVVTLQEGDPLDEVKRRVWFVYPVYKMIFKMADCITAISSHLANFAREMGARRVEVIPNGVDLEKFKIKNETRLPVGQELKIDDDKIVLITTGRLVKKNAVDDIIKSLQFLPENVLFRSIGSGEEGEHLRDLARELGLESRVEFLPAVGQDDLPSLLYGADIFIRPSISEGLGNSFLEAMAVGLPVIGTNVGGIPDFLKDDETGLFCQVRSPEDIAKKVLRLVGDDGLRQRISRNSRKLIEEKYDWDIVAKKYELYL